MQDIPGLERFQPVALQLGDEEELLERAHHRLVDLDPGTIAVLPEYLAWTTPGSVRAYLTLAEIAHVHNLSIITTLNLPPDLTEDLPGRDRAARYNALIIFTRHGDVHVPQAKWTPQPFETSHTLAGPGIGVAPYLRLNRVRLDVGDGELVVRFLICSDLWALTRRTPAALACDLLVVPGNFARDAEAEAAQALAAAREAGAARATLLCNAFQIPHDGRQPLAREVEELFTAEREPAPAWPDETALADHFRVLDEKAAESFIAMVESPERDGRIGIPHDRADAPLDDGIYPLTICL